MVLFALLEGLLWVGDGDMRAYWSRNRHFVVASVVFALLGSWLLAGEAGRAGRLTGLLASLMLTVAGLTRFMRVTRARWFSRIHPGLIALGSFAAAIVVGMGLLMTPRATAPGVELGWIDALFQSASAVCVTGLITVDTETTFTTTGHCILLLLIQAGGLGIMTWAYLAAALWGENLSLHDRILLKDVLRGREKVGLKRRVMEIVVVTLAIEAVGFLLLLFSWRDVAGDWGEKCFAALFHAVSGYCNAGFSTFSGNLADARVRQEGFGLGVVAALVVLGGLGMPVLADLGGKIKAWCHRLVRSPGERPKRAAFSFHTKVALGSTAVLLVGGALVLGLFHYFEEGERETSWGVAMFDSVTARTAGFNLEDVGAYPQSVAAILMLLMFIGGCPSGTAGGIKCTTFAIILINLKQVLLNQREPHLWRRTIARQVVSRSFSILTLSGCWVAVTAILLQLLHPQMSFIDLSFEAASAFATVGLSRGVTAELSVLGKLILVVTMLVGRLGILLVFASVLPAPPSSRIDYPRESPFVG